MQAKGRSKHTDEQIAEAVRRYGDGESVAVLSKYYKISKPGFYLWLNKAKEKAIANSKVVNMTPSAVDRMDKKDLVAEIQALRAKVTSVQNKLFALMLETGRLE